MKKSKNICNSYHEEFDRPVCYGTREKEEATCEGDRARCDFYPENRTAESPELKLGPRESIASKIKPVVIRPSKNPKIKFKIFPGTFGTSILSRSADEKVNAWLEEHPNVDVVWMKYQQARYGDHSICIAYQEVINGAD